MSSDGRFPAGGDVSEHHGEPPGAASEEVLAPRFVISRRYAANSGGARGLLITVLGEFARPTGQPTPTSAFIDVFGRLGIQEKACRQALARAAADGWLVPIRRGRQTCWQLSPPCLQFLTLGAQRIYGFAPVQRDWDRRWLLVLARAGESNRSVRHLLRTRLRWAGFGSPAPATWISPHVDRVGEAEFILREAGVHGDAQIFSGEYLAGGDLPGLVRQAWDLEEIAQGYQGFLEEFTDPAADDPLVCLTRIVHSWRRLMLLDPTLPHELLPAGWIGVPAGNLFVEQQAGWRRAALREWERLSVPGC
ncbi:MAG: phenylacetic acid degradation operon negative regulatory protein [Actinomycetota bacterium]|nr:phenylacetic acid degradation operon negative regulatory protein [Actinomycetota bacterium]